MAKAKKPPMRVEAGEAAMSFPEIARRLGKKTSAVRMLYYSGLRRAVATCPNFLALLNEQAQELAAMRAARAPMTGEENEE